MYKSIEHNGYTISYQLHGSKKPAVILIHGFPEDSTVFVHQYNYLKEKCTVLVPDLPGSGKSSQNLSLQSISDFADILELILKHEDIKQCYFLGHSMGGYVALAYAEKYPEQLSGLGLIHSTAYADSPDKKENRQRSIELMEQYGGFSFLKSTVPNLFSKEHISEHQNDVNGLIEKGKNFDTKTLQQYYFIMKERPDRSDVLKKITVPVLFIIGEKDNAIPVNDTLQQTHLPNVSFINILPEAAHIGFLEYPDKVNEFIETFILST